MSKYIPGTVALFGCWSDVCNLGDRVHLAPAMYQFFDTTSGPLAQLSGSLLWYTRRKQSTCSHSHGGATMAAKQSTLFGRTVAKEPFFKCSQSNSRYFEVVNALWQLDDGDNKERFF